MLVKKLSFVCLVLSAISAINVLAAEDEPSAPAAPAAAAADSPALAVNQAIKGKQVAVPFFDPEMTTISEERKQWNVEFSTEYHKLLRQTNEDIFVKKASLKTVSSDALKFHNLLKEKKKEITELIVKEGGDPKKQTDFYRMILGLAREILEAGKEEAKKNGGGKIKREKPTELKAKQFLADLDQMHDLIHETIVASPVGGHVNWKQMTVDSVPLTEVGGKYVAFYYEAGPKGVLPIIHQLIKWAEKLI